MRKKKIIINSNEYEYQVQKDSETVKIHINGQDFEFNRKQLEKTPAISTGGGVHIWKHEDYYEAEKLSLMGQTQSMGAGSLKSPMPGKIFKIILSEGSSVKAGETILILEAMKMEHSIKSPIDGVISAINFSEGEIVDGGVSLATVEEKQ